MLARREDFAAAAAQLDSNVAAAGGAYAHAAVGSRMRAAALMPELEATETSGNATGYIKEGCARTPSLKYRGARGGT